MNNIAATLCFNTPELAKQMRVQMQDIFIIDNGSDIPIPGADIRFDEPLGFVKGWNAFMKMCMGMRVKTVWMLNSDVVGISERMYDSLIGTMRSNKDVAAVTPLFNSPHEIFHRRETDFSRPRWAGWIDWCCPVVNVEAWKKVGPFDEQSTGYFADVDWCRRAREEGYRFAIDTGCEVYHMGQETISRTGKMWDANEDWLRRKWNVSTWMDVI